MTAPALHVIDAEARTPLGRSAAAAAAAVRAGINRIAEHPFMLDPTGEPVRVVRDAAIDPALFGPARLLALARAPLEALLGRLPAGVAPDVTLLLAAPEHRPGWEPADQAALVASLTALLQRRFGKARVIVSGKGHAGALQAFHAAAELTERAHADICLVGAVDSYLHPDTLDWLFAQRRVVTDQTRSAFFPGEAAGFLAVAGAVVRRQARLASLAEIVATEVAVEANVLGGERECLGAGLSAALEGLAARGLRPGERIERVICDVNGERYRAQEWGLAVLRAEEIAFRDATDYDAPAGCWGDVGAASGALFAILAAQGWARGYAAGPNALLFAGSDGGLRGAALLRSTVAGGAS